MHKDPFTWGCARDCRSERGVEAPRLNVRARSRSIRCGDYAPLSPFWSRQILLNAKTPALATDIIFSDFAASEFELAFEGQIPFFGARTANWPQASLSSPVPPSRVSVQAGD